MTMKEIRIKLYQFDELGEEAKDKAREWCRDDDGIRGQWAWDQVKEDAENVKLAILEISDHRANRGHFIGTPLDTLEAIMKDHGAQCETYKTAARYQESLKGIEQHDENGDETGDFENWAHEFLHDILEDYRVMYNHDIEYAYSQEAIDEDIRGNEYEFTEKGKRS